MATLDVNIDSLRLETNFFRGIRFPFLFKSENLEEALSFRPHDEDIVLLTYPKTGTNWTMHIVLNLLNSGHFDGDFASAQKSCPFIEALGTKNLKPGSFYMTHLPINVDTFNPNAKYIIVLRNPRDVAVSFYHFSTQIATSFGNFPKDVYWFPRFAELFVKGETWYGDYMEYHRHNLDALQKHGNPGNILYVVYEKMKKEPRREIIRIANFLGGKAAGVVKDEEVVRGILTRTSVEFMRESAKKSVIIGDDSDEPRHASVNFVRRGVVGDHVNYFTPEISKMFDDYIASDPRNREIMQFFEA